MTTTTQQQSRDLLGLHDSKQAVHHTSVEHDKAPIEPFVDEKSRTDTEVDNEAEADDSKFAPNKVYYIQSHVMGSKEIVIVDITGQVPVTFVDGKNVSEEFRDAAKKIGATKDATPAFRFTKKHWYNKSYKVYRGTDDSTPLAEWKHPVWSTGTATLEFPAGSKHCPHNLDVKPVKWTRRTNEFVVESVPLSWHFDDKYKSHRLTLSKKIAGVESTIARYSQKWSAWWHYGGVILIDDREVDDLVALLTTCIMLRRAEQRRWERSGSSGGGGGGGGG